MHNFHKNYVGQAIPVPRILSQAYKWAQYTREGQNGNHFSSVAKDFRVGSDFVICLGCSLPLAEVLLKSSAVWPARARVCLAPDPAVLICKRFLRVLLMLCKPVLCSKQLDIRWQQGLSMFV